MTCRECDRAGRLVRGLCVRCYGRAYYVGTHVEHPRALHTYEDLVEDVRLLAASGESREQIAARLGLRPGSLHRQLLRHGDQALWARLQAAS